MNDIEIARSTKLKNIANICENIGILEDEIEFYGKYKAKISLDIFKRLQTKSNGKLVLVSAMTPTKKGEGKSTITIGLTQAINKLGFSSIAAIREPSMGPVFGLKGGATGGGYSQVLPMEDINLHFTGDFHAITATHNLIAASIDNHIYWGNELNIDINNIYFKRVTDTNDRALRNVSINDKKYTRDSSFQITVASEIMAILCLCDTLSELKEKISNIVVAKSTDGKLITVKDLNIAGSCAVLLKDAIKPNIVQTTENTPVLIHGGPFANIAHGSNSIISTKLALKLSEYTITEAGFAADLGAEKFFDITCRKAHITPDAVVLVVTCRAVKEHGLENIKAHIENIENFNVPIVVSLNLFNDDEKDEVNEIVDYVENLGYQCVVTNSHKYGGDGAITLANAVIDIINQKDEVTREDVEKKCINNFEYLYGLDIDIKDKINTLATKIYRASNVEYSELALEKLEYFKDKINNLPICISKTPVSISDKANIKGVPKDYTFNVSDIRPAFGAGFVVVMCGDIIDMPGLPKVPAANFIDIDENEEIIGLF